MAPETGRKNQKHKQSGEEGWILVDACAAESGNFSKDRPPQHNDDNISSVQLSGAATDPSSNMAIASRFGLLSLFHWGHSGSGEAVGNGSDTSADRPSHPSDQTWSTENTYRGDSEGRPQKTKPVKSGQQSAPSVDLTQSALAELQRGLPDSGIFRSGESAIPGFCIQSIMAAAGPGSMVSELGSRRSKASYVSFGSMGLSNSASLDEDEDDYTMEEVRATGAWADIDPRVFADGRLDLS